MIKVVKDGLTTYVKDNAMLAIYLANGWSVSKKQEDPIPEQSVEPEVTKKELQKKLDELKVAYKPQENKSALMDKLKKASPANNFDDGLLKG
jgi:hypothetical protein